MAASQASSYTGRSSTLSRSEWDELRSVLCLVKYHRPDRYCATAQDKTWKHDHSRFEFAPQSIFVPKNSGEPSKEKVFARGNGREGRQRPPKSARQVTYA